MGSVDETGSDLGLEIFTTFLNGSSFYFKCFIFCFKEPPSISLSFLVTPINITVEYTT